MTFARENQSSSIHPSTTNDHDSDASHDASDARDADEILRYIYTTHPPLRDGVENASAPESRPRIYAARARAYILHVDDRPRNATDDLRPETRSIYTVDR